MYPIRIVSQMTGINPVTLRAWERRYGLIQPQRTPKGHRLYSEQNIEEIGKVRNLLDQGIPISRVRNVLEQRQAVAVEEAGEGWCEYHQRIIESIHRFDEFALETVYNEALSLYPIDLVTDKLLLPLLKQLGEQWEKQKGGIAEEHFFSMYLRNKLGAQLHHSRQKQQGSVLVGACFPGEHHVLGLLLFTLSASERGYRVILLGADLPLEELLIVANQTELGAIALSCSAEIDWQQHHLTLSTLVKQLKIPIFIGGKGTLNQYQAIEMTGAIPVGEDLKTSLNIIMRILPP